MCSTCQSITPAHDFQHPHPLPLQSKYAVNKMKISHSFRLALVPGLIAAACLCWAASKPKQLSSYDPEAKALLARMTLEEKIGQMTQPEQNELKDPADVENYFVGSVLSGGSSDPKEGNSLKAWTDLYDRLQARTQNTRLKIPLLYGIDAVHGHNNVLDAVIFPHNIGLGCTRNPKLVEQVHRVTAEEVRATGIQWAFGPCVTVPQDIRWGRTYEGFSEDPKLVRELAGAAPSAASRAPASTIPSACWPAPSTTSAMAALPSAPHQEPASTRAIRRVDEATLRRIHLPGYLAAIEAGVGTIMPSYSSWNGVKCSASKRLLTDILKNELGFQGFLISDYNAIDQIDQGLQGSRRHFDQRRHGHGDGAHPLPRVLQRPQSARQRRQGADVAHRRRRTAHSARQVRHGPDGSQTQSAGRPRTAEDLRLARASRRGARRPCASRSSCSRTTARLCRSPRRPRACTSPARTPTTSAISAAAGPSTGRAGAATSPPAAPPSSPPSRTPSPRTPG